MSPRRPQRILSAAVTLTLLAAAATGLAACNTVAGAGRDVSSLGHDLTGGATATQSGISNGSNGHLATQ